MQADTVRVPFYRRRWFPLVLAALIIAVAVPLLYPWASHAIGAAALRGQIAGRWGAEIGGQRSIYELKPDGSFSLVDGRPIPYLPQVGKWDVEYVTFRDSGSEDYALICETTDYTATWSLSMESPKLTLIWQETRGLDAEAGQAAFAEWEGVSNRPPTTGFSFYRQ